MRFSWKAIVLAPLAVPVVASIILATAPSQNRLRAGLFFLALACVLSYGVSLVAFLPSMFVLSRVTRLTAPLTAALGMMLGLAVYVPLGWQSYLASDDNSGPPAGTFLQYLWHDSWSESWVFYASGLITAML